MRRERPTRREGGTHEDYIEEHPAYGMIGASRVSSSPGEYLFGSDFQHQHYVTVSIYGATLHRSLSRDWVSAGDQMIEVALSEAQWASFVSSMNVGHGVSCTVQRKQGIGILPGIEAITDRRDQINAEVMDKMNDALATLTELRDAAPNKKLRAMAEQAMQQLKSNIPFVADQFDEHVEKTVEKAKIEVNAYVTQAVNRAGLAALGGAQTPFLLTTDEEADDD